MKKIELKFQGSDTNRTVYNIMLENFEDMIAATSHNLSSIEFKGLRLKIYECLAILEREEFKKKYPHLICAPKIDRDKLPIGPVKNWSTIAGDSPDNPWTLMNGKKVYLNELKEI